MKIILVGATGTIGKHVASALQDSKHEVIKVGKTKGDFQVDIESSESIASLYKKIGAFDAVANASGHVAFAPFQDIKKDQWASSLNSKLMGQINLVREAIPYINEGGSFTLVSGIIGDEFILGGTIASTVNKALEGFVTATACELPKKLRINLVSPALLEDSLGVFGDYFPGFIPVDGKSVGQAYKKAILGIQSGQVLKV